MIHALRSSTVAATAIVATMMGCSSATSPAPIVGDAQPPSPDGGSPLESVDEALARMLSGSFDSKDQAAADRSYFEISLEVCPIQVRALGAHVLYVEQARIGSAPYRQRFYVIEKQGERTAVSRVFELRAPKAWVGACTKGAPPAAAEDAEEKAGCAVVMHRVGDGFRGATGDLAWDGQSFEANPTGARCPSDLNGASYASSTVELGASEMVSWDRGYDANGKQVWGATAGGYRFVRRR